jgi:nitroreductase
MNLLDNLNWRYATKQFDPTKKVSKSDLELIKEAISLTATSYGLQSFKVLIVENQEIKEQLLPASWGQAQINQAPQLLVFCSYNEVTNGDIDAFLKLKSDVQGIELENLKGYGDFMKSTIGSFPPEATQSWTKKQTYIALGNAMAACAELKIDSCPMEGFDAEKYNEILGLNDQGLTAALVLPIGYRSEDDQTQHGKKVRKPLSEIFEVV